MGYDATGFAFLAIRTEDAAYDEQVIDQFAAEVSEILEVNPCWTVEANGPFLELNYSGRYSGAEELNDIVRLIAPGQFISFADNDQEVWRLVFTGDTVQEVFPTWRMPKLAETQCGRKTRRSAR